MLMLFFFCAPMHAQTPTFKSTSSYRIANPNYSAQQLDPTTIGHETYRSTIYTPFGSSTPSSNNNPGGNNDSGSGNSDGEDVGSPDWGGTMSEPLPITDGTPFLLLIAATMITIIAIKQRKQKQLQSITTNNNNDTTPHMTTRKQTYQSFFQKLFLLLAFVCIAGNTFAWKPIMIGHRGCRQGVENTAEAFTNGATTYGFNALECDVKVTSDNQYVCWHDNDIANSMISNRDYAVSISGNTLSNLQALELTQTRNGKTYTGRICTLREFLTICKNHNVTPVVELKYTKTITEAGDLSGLDGIYKIIKELNMEDKVIILGFKAGLIYFHDNYPNIQCMWLTNSISDSHIETCRQYGWWIDSQPYLDYEKGTAITAAQIKKCQDAGVKVGLWTINNTTNCNTYAGYGVNFITTDDIKPSQLTNQTGTDPNNTKMIYFRPGTTNFSQGWDVSAESSYSAVFWIKNGYTAMAIHNPTTDKTEYIAKGRTKEEIMTGDISNRFLSMVLPEGYTQIAAYRLSNISSHGTGKYGYADWDHSSNISNRIPVKNTTPNFIDIPTDGKNLLVHYEGYWNYWYWAYYLPKNNDVCIYFANTGDWSKVKMLTGKDIYTFPTSEFTSISETKLRYLSLAGNEYGYTHYGFINSSSDNLSKGWNAGLIPPVNCDANDKYAFDGTRKSGDNTVTANATNKSTYGITIDKLSDNLIADRIKDAPNYTALREDLLKGINLFTPAKSTNGSAVNKTSITSWQDLNHTHTVTIETGGKVNYKTTWLTGASTSKSNSEANNTGTITFTAAYTATVTLRAIPDDGYVFLGFYDAESNQFLGRGTEEEYTSGSTTYPTTYKYQYEAPNKDKKIIAKFVKGSGSVLKDVRATIYDGSPLKNSLDGGSFTMTHSGGSVYTHTKVGYVTDIPVAIAPVTFEATANDGYEFIAWFNDRKGQFLDNPWTMTDPSKYDESVTAVFASKKDYAKRQNINISGLGTVSANYTFYPDKTTETTFSTNSSFVAWKGTTVKLTAEPKNGYVFDGWYSGDSKVSSDLSIYGGAGYKADAEFTLTAKFIQLHKQNLRASQGGSVLVEYNDGSDKTATVRYESALGFYSVSDKNVTLTATADADYVFAGWRDTDNGSIVSTDNPYSYLGNITRNLQGVFALSTNEHTLTVMTYDPTYNEYKPTNPGGSVNYVVTSPETNKTTETAAAIPIGRSGIITLTPTPKEGYEFIGWYENDTLITEGVTNNVLSYTGGDAGRHITARFAAENCLKLTLTPNSAGTYVVKYGKTTDKANYYSKESSLTEEIIAYAPMNMCYGIVSAQPILGYKFQNMYPGGLFEKYQYTLGQYSGTQQGDRSIVVDFVRTEEQMVYLHLNNQWGDKNHKYYVYATNIARKKDNVEAEFKWIEMIKEGDIYKINQPIPANTYSHIVFVQFASNEATPTKALTKQTSPKPTNKTEYLTIPATRQNCYKLNFYWVNGEYTSAWTECPTAVGDFKVVYREQTVVSKTEIRPDYEHSSDVIKKSTTGKTDTVSVHIYNKVSDGLNGLNNPEVILQRCTGFVDGKSQWEDVERRMVFGPLKATNEGVIRMPNRKNAGATIVVDNGIDAIKNDDQDNGSGVWNFTIVQDNNGASAHLDLKQLHRYEGPYFIRTANATGMAQNFTHPENVMTYAPYAYDNNKDFSHYYCRWIDVPALGQGDGKAIGNYTSVKFAVANKYACYLSKELYVNNNRFTDGICEDEYEDDLFVEHREGIEPRLSMDANVRFGWDIRTNRLTRAYIADSNDEDSEHLVIEGNNLTPTSATFIEEPNWLYHIDLKAKAGAKATVRAKAKVDTNEKGTEFHVEERNQYFFGEEGAPETLLGGSGTGTYDIRVLYDFKEDHFTTIYYPQGTISGNVDINTPVMILREHHEAPTQVTFSTNATVSAEKSDAYGKPAYAVMTFRGDKLTDPAITHHEKMFYWVSFPYNVKIKDVFGLGKYGKYWIMQYYDGEQRSKTGLAQTNWKYITNTGTELEANKGYIICLNYSQLVSDGVVTKDNEVSLYFPSMSNVNAMTITGGQRRTVELARYENANTAWNHHNWHLIGVPSFADPTLTDVQTDVPFVYVYWHPGDAYAAKAYDEITFHAMHSYMVQYHGNIYWSSIVNTTGSVTPSKLAAKTDEEADKKVMLRLELQQAGSTLDKTYVQLRNDKGTKGFDMSLDLTKIINAGANIYSIVDNHEMAGNAIPKDETVLPLGVVITAAGEYTFAMPNGTEGMIVELIDYEQGTSTNLLMSDYTITLDKGTFNQRFALRLKPDKVATSVDNIGNGANGDEVRKLLIDGVLYLQQGTNTYDAQGKHVQ